MLINTAFGVASVRKEWLNVARTLEVGTLRRAFTIILPARRRRSVTGMRISIGIAWLVIVAAEMLVGGTGIGYFVWNEWNNLSITNVIIAILLIGLVGMVLDRCSRASAARDVSGVGDDGAAYSVYLPLEGGGRPPKQRTGWG
jgi:nitrate/nitrite transport system permease protein